MKEIYALVGLPSLYLDCLRKIHKLEVDAKSTDKITESNNIKRSINQYTTNQFFLRGALNIGYFESIEKAEKFMEEKALYLSDECFPMIVLERHTMNSWHNFTFEPIFYENCFKGSTGVIEYKKLERPEFLKDLANFAE